MNYLILGLLLSISVYAQEDCEPDTQSDSISAVTALAIPNCNTKELLYKARSGQTQELCGTCKNKFERTTSKTIPTKSKDEIQSLYFNTSLNEYKKVLTDNLISAVRLMALRPTGSDFKKSIQACQMKTSEDFLKSCSSNKAKELFRSSSLLKDIQKETSKELAVILSTEAINTQNTLLKRTPPSCFVPERQILYIANSIIEEAFTPELIDYFKSLPIEKFADLDELFVSDEFIAKFGDQSELKNSFISHPLLSQFLKSPQKAHTFFNSINSPSSSENLKKSLYSKNSGDEFDQNLADSCTRSFEKLKSSICSTEFENGSLSLEGIKNHPKLFSSELIPSKGNLSTTEEILKKNEYLLSLCENSKPNYKSLSECTEVIGASLAEKYKVQSFEEFKTDKFLSEIGSVNEAICSANDNLCNGDASATFQCKAYNKFKALSNSDSIDSKLALSSNKEGNALLRSMIGDTSKVDLDPKTKEILVLNGIIPKDDGTLVAQADIPERKPEFYNNPNPAQTQQASAGQVTPGSGASKAALAPRPQQQQRDLYSSDQYAQNANFQPNSQMPDISDLMRDSDQNLREVQDEIMRRLSDLPNNRPATKDQARAIARNAYRSKGASLSASQEEALANRLMARPSTTQTSPDDFFNDRDPARNEVASTKTETAAEKFKKDGMNRALADMAGARAAAAAAGTNGRGPASTNEDGSKQLTNVALNISDDPRVSLSQLFSEKFNKNDPETQLLKVLVNSKKNFLLTVRNVNFKVVFDEKSNMNLLLDSGDREAAQQLRPQLEIFFRRLRSN